MNDLESRILEWKRRLKRNPSFEESDILEMESHFRSLIGEFMEKGMDEESAFRKAAARFGEVEEVAEDVYKVRTTKKVGRPSWQQISWVPILLPNYLKTLIRNITRYKFYTSLNLVGLAIGFACCFCILLYIQHERSYDRHHDKADRIYRATMNYQFDGGSHWAPIGPPAADALKSGIPEIEEVTRFFPFGGDFVLFGRGENRFQLTEGVYADSTVFDVFSYPLRSGNPETALKAPRSVVLSQELARTIFGEENPVGQTLQLMEREDYHLTVTGVLEPMPETTHIPFNYMISLSTFYDNELAAGWNPDNSLTWAGFYTYVLLRESVGKEAVEQKLPAFLDQFLASLAEPGTAASESVSMVLQPLTDIHLHSSLEKEYRANGDIRYVYLFGIVAIFVLLIACANFINLTTARAGDRMREIGIRKTLGSGRRQLAFQFLSESVLLSLTALLLAWGLTLLLLPTLNQVTGNSFQADLLLTPDIIWSFLAISLVAGLLSGSYPAIYMSGFSPVKVLKGVAPDSSSSTFLRKGLVVFQFAISLFLIIGTVVVYSQLNYLQTREMGFDKEGIINIPLYGEFGEFVDGNRETVKEELLRNPDIISASIGGDYPGKRYSMEGVRPEGWDEEEDLMVRIAMNGIDHDYTATLGVKIVAGRNFSRHSPADTNAWLVNEAAVRALELEEPVGQMLHWGDYSGPIVGVVEDFNYRSLHSPIEPLVIPLRPDRGSTLFVRTRAGSIPRVLEFLEQEVKKAAPGAVFEYSFLSEQFDSLYRTENRMSSIFWYFSLVAILIACLGLFGLSTYTINQRAKEIGVRKVLGASAQTIVMLVSWRFIRLIGIAFVLAAPASWLVMNGWLNSFAYKTDLAVWMFGGAGILVLALSLATVGWQAFRSALANPVKLLRSE